MDGEAVGGRGVWGPALQRTGGELEPKKRRNNDLGETIWKLGLERPAGIPPRPELGEQ